MGYVERTLTSKLMACTWERTSVSEDEQRVVPDACVDLIWSGEELFVAGPDTRPRLVQLRPGSRIVGVRLRPGAAGTVLGLPASTLCDLSVDACEVLGRDVVEPLLDELHGQRDPHASLSRAVELCAGGEPDPLIGAAISALGHPRARVAVVATELGLSARQLQRRVSDAVGYGPKTLQRVLRFRLLQRLPSAPLAERALYAGYADQAHMTAEVTRLAGTSPVRFLKDWRPTAA